MSGASFVFQLLVLKQRVWQRTVYVVVLALALIACNDLAEVPSGTCGNLVVEAAEQCDGQDGCGTEGPAACRWVCQVGGRACPLGLAPTTSTVALLALGDALAMTVLHRRGFSPEQFAELHPAGSLGKRLLRVAHPLLELIKLLAIASQD